jgi:trigger factor
MSAITVEKTAEDLASRSLRVTVPVDRVEEAEARALKYYAKRARLPGFRQGKAPEAVVRRRFGDAIRQTVLEEVVREGWEEARTAESLEPVAEPSIRNLKFEAGSPIEFELLVEVRPSLKLARRGGFTLTRQVRPVTDEAVEEQLQALREQKATWLPVDGARPTEGQMVRVEVTSLDGDGPAEPQSHDVVLGEQRAVQDLEVLIMSLEPGQTAEGEITFPDDHPDEARRGQSRRVRVTLHEVKRKELPPVDDALAREVGEFDSLDALRDTIRTDLAGDAVREADRALREQLLAELASANDVPAPESLVHRVMHAYAHAYGIPEEQVHTFEHQFHGIAESTVRRDLILGAVVEQEQLAATEADVDAKVAEMAAARGVETGQLYASLQKANRLPELERALTEEKAFAWLLAQSTVNEVSA